MAWTGRGKNHLTAVVYWKHQTKEVRIMTDQEILQAMSQMMDQKLVPIIDRLDALEESQEETRNGVNMLISWSEKVSMAAKFPLPDIDD